MTATFFGNRAVLKAFQEMRLFIFVRRALMLLSLARGQTGSDLHCVDRLDPAENNMLPYILTPAFLRFPGLCMFPGEAKKLATSKQRGHSYAAFQRAYKEAKTCNKLQQQHQQHHPQNPASNPSQPLSPVTPKQNTPTSAAAPLPLVTGIGRSGLGGLNLGFRQGAPAPATGAGGCSSSSSSDEDDDDDEGGRGGTTRAAAAARGAKQAALTNINMQR